MRHLFICTLLCILPIAGLAQTTGSHPLPRQAKSSELSRSSLQGWEDRLMASDPKVRAIAATALVRGARSSLPLLRRLLALDNEDLLLKTFDIIGGSVRRPFRCSLNCFGMNRRPSGASPLMP